MTARKGAAGGVTVVACPFIDDPDLFVAKIQERALFESVCAAHAKHVLGSVSQ